LVVAILVLEDCWSRVALEGGMLTELELSFDRRDGRDAYKRQDKVADDVRRTCRKKSAVP
jgi:hypothetical protein